MKWHWVLVLLILAACSREEVAKISFDNSNLIISAEIADSSNEWQIGLMNRTTLAKNSGMLFIFPTSSEKSFWMKNTLIPLDMIFIDSDYNVVAIQNAIPCLEDPCITYPSGKPIKYVLEVNGEFAQKNNIKVGSMAKIQLPK